MVAHLPVESRNSSKPPLKNKMNSPWLANLPATQICWTMMNYVDFFLNFNLWKTLWNPFNPFTKHVCSSFRWWTASTFRMMHQVFDPFRSRKLTAPWLVNCYDLWFTTQEKGGFIQKMIDIIQNMVDIIQYFLPKNKEKTSFTFFFIGFVVGSNDLMGLNGTYLLVIKHSRKVPQLLRCVFSDQTLHLVRRFPV